MNRPVAPATVPITAITASRILTFLGGVIYHLKRFFSVKCAKPAIVQLPEKANHEARFIAAGSTNKMATNVPAATAHRR